MAGTKKGSRNEEAKALARSRDLPNARTADDADALKRAFADHLQYSQGKDEHTATPMDRYFAAAHTVRDRMMRRWIQTQQTYYKRDAKRVYYLSLEFLMGRLMENNLINLGLQANMKAALADLGLDLNELLAQEPDAGLGNGGLGRLAACFLDSMATLQLPAYGYGIRYEFGIFDQEIRNGYQVERPEEWLRFGCAWEIPRPEAQVPIRLYGRTEHWRDGAGKLRVRWVDGRRVMGMPYDVPVAGYGEGNVNTLRLWRARASQEIDLANFNAGDYLRAVEEKDLSENISKVLYPNDLTVMGKELRLQQQYFFVSCSIHDIVTRHLKVHEASATSPTRWPSSSTTPTRPSPSPSSCGCWWTSTSWSGTPPGGSAAPPSATRTTPCCPRRSSGGAWTSSGACCRATSSSSTRSTPASWTSAGPPGGRTRGPSRACRSSRRAG